MKVALSTWGRFHFFHLARQLEARNALLKIYSTYPRFKLKDEFGIPRQKIETDSLIETFVLGKNRLGLLRSAKLDEILTLAKVYFHDYYLTSKLRSLDNVDRFVALSGSGFAAGPAMQKRGGKYICDRGSTHIAYADEIMTEEFSRFGRSFRKTHPRHIEREAYEYEVSDKIVVPSSFAKRSFVEKGVVASKIDVIPYGVELTRFDAKSRPPKDDFVVLFVGGVRFRKGIPYLLDAFENFKHPRKKLLIAGGISDEIKDFLSQRKLENVHFLGIIPNKNLSEVMSSAHVLVLPSVEEGLALVQAEALASGCPVIATPNTGSEDLFEHRKQGFIVPVRSAAAITSALEELADNPNLREQMSEAAISRAKAISGWGKYGSLYFQKLEEM